MCVSQAILSKITLSSLGTTPQIPNPVRSGTQKLAALPQKNFLKTDGLLGIICKSLTCIVLLISFICDLTCSFLE
jgi:hypothetical protein